MADIFVRSLCIDDPDIVRAIYELARIATERQVKPHHWGLASDPVMARTRAEAPVE